MYGVLQRRVEQAGDDRQERLMLSFDKMFAREKGNPLWSLFDFWNANRVSFDQIPSLDEFKYKSKLPRNITRYISWSDVTAEDPLNFVMHDHPNLTEFNDHSNCRLGDHPIPMNAKACAIEYLHCIHSRQPTYFEIDQSFGTISRHMVRLMVPVMDDNNKVTRLVYAVRIINSSAL